jgi:hypothetical protein
VAQQLGYSDLWGLSSSFLFSLETPSSPFLHCKLSSYLFLLYGFIDVFGMVLINFQGNYLFAYSFSLFYSELLGART